MFAKTAASRNASERAERPPTHAGRGMPIPLGVSETCDGINLAVFSCHATGMSVLIYEATTRERIDTFPLDPARNRTGDVWHVQLSRDVLGKSYVIKADGPWSPAEGHLFDPRVPLLDPYAVALVKSAHRNTREGGIPPHVEPSTSVAQGLIILDRFDWQDDKPPRHPWQDTIIYETHLRGFSIHPSAISRHPGSYLGLIEKIPYLQKLGITAVELMPIQEFNDHEIRRRAGKPVRNYWGYNPVAFFAPKADYASDLSAASALVECKTMVRELHKAGIEVILDVVFNHTAEGDETGPTFSFRGLDNSIYYILDPESRRYVDYTGCGNTLNCNHPVVRSLIVDCLRHWVVHFHVDGFRFDLASILGRDGEGKLISNPPLLEQIAEDPLLRHVKLIAEAWDLGGAFQVGRFPGHRWAEWNCHFRDQVRRFWRGDPGMTGFFATRLCGSADLYQRERETPVNSINFVTCHDGFTLNDLVSYSRKRNEANGEDNKDGTDENYSDNNGTEGPANNAEIEAIRLRQIKNFLVTLFVSRGVPMLLGGDEFRRTQQGNNNAYCQDNEVSWYDWQCAKRNADLVRFVERLIAFRKAHPVLCAERFYTDTEIRWFGADGGPPEWNGRDNRIGCIILNEERRSESLCLLFNAARQPCRFLVSPPAGDPWRVAVDTSQASPMDIPEPRVRRVIVGSDAIVGARSAQILISE